MNKEVLNSIFESIKDNKHLPSPTPDLVLVLFNPTQLEKVLVRKHGEELTKETLKGLFDMGILAIREDDHDSYIKGHQKKAYHIRLDKLQELL